MEIISKPSENHPKTTSAPSVWAKKTIPMTLQGKNLLEFGHDFLPLQTLSKHLQKQPLPSCKTSWGSGSAGQRLIPSPIRLQRKRHCPRQEALSDYPELHFLHTGGLRGFSCHWLFIVETVVNTWTKYCNDNKALESREIQTRWHLRTDKVHSGRAQYIIYIIIFWACLYLQKTIKNHQS